MRNVTIQEVDLGCLACEGERFTSNTATAFVCGVLAGMTKDELPFCTKHYRGFQRAADGIASSAPTSSVEEKP